MVVFGDGVNSGLVELGALADELVVREGGWGVLARDYEVRGLAGKSGMINRR